RWSMGDVEDVGLASVLGRWGTRRERAAKGVIHIKGAAQAWEMNRQGRCRFYAHLGRTDLANPDWICFRHEIHSHSGVHVHQGGLALDRVGRILKMHANSREDITEIR